MPYVVGLLLGLLVGFIVGVIVGSEEQRRTDATTTDLLAWGSHD